MTETVKEGKIAILESKVQELEKENRELKAEVAKLKSDACWEAEYQREKAWTRPREDGGYQGGA